MQEDTNTGPQGSGRYASPRRCLRWEDDTHLAIVKMLAWKIHQEERSGTNDLWGRMHDLCASVILDVTGERGVTFEVLLARTKEEHGIEITPNRLMQRADKTERNDEFNEWLDDVERAYDRAVVAF